MFSSRDAVITAKSITTIVTLINYIQTRIVDYRTLHMTSPYFTILEGNNAANNNNNALSVCSKKLSVPRTN